MLAAQDLHVRFRSAQGDVAALRGVSIHVKPGERVGVVGESGAGKTTLARALVGLVKPSQGHVSAPGGVQLVFQDAQASLNPRQSVRATLEEALLHGPKHDDLSKLLPLVGLSSVHLKRKNHELSGGEAQRVALARALAVGPAYLVLDEPWSSLDAVLRRQTLALLVRISEERNVGLVVVSHDLPGIANVCERLVVLYAGRVVEEGPCAEVLRAPAHPYTQALLAAVPTASRVPLALTGEAPSPLQPIQGCAFHPRCALAEARCLVDDPALRPRNPEHQTACWVQ